MRIETVVVAIGYDLQKGIHILINGLELPRIFLDDYHTVQQDALKLLKDFTGIHGTINGTMPGWVPLFYVDIFSDIDRKENDKRCVAIVYACILPSLTPSPGQWIHICNLKTYELHNDHWNIIQTALLRRQ